MILCIDPGLRGCGVALFTNRARLEFAAYVKNPEQSARGPEAWVAMANAVWDLLDGKWINLELLTEQMSVSKGRDGGGAKGGIAKINDLLEINGVVGAISSAFNVPARGVRPDEWKSNVDADVMIERARQKLSPEETANVVPCAASLEHNVYDAIGLGLWRFNRLHTRVIAR